MSAIYYAGYDDDYYLMHHGTKGQKWGRRLYQNPDGSLTPLGRAHYGIGEARRKFETYREERIQKGISKAIAKGDADTLYKYRSRLSQQQINDAVNRIQMTQKLSDLTSASKKAKRDDAVTTVTNVLKKAGNLLNAYSGLTEAIQKIKDNSPEAKAKKKEEERIENIKKSDEYKEITKRARNDANDAANKLRKNLEKSKLSSEEIENAVDAEFAKIYKQKMSGISIGDDSVVLKYKDKTKNKPMDPPKTEKADEPKEKTAKAEKADASNAKTEKAEEKKDKSTAPTGSSTSIAEIRKKLFESAEKYDKQKAYNANWGPKASVRKAQNAILSDKDAVKKEVNEQFNKDKAYQLMLEKNRQKRRKVRIL